MQVRSQTMHSLANYSPKPIFTRKKSLLKLTTNKDIIISPAEKGDAVVILNIPADT